LDIGELYPIVCHNGFNLCPGRGRGGKGRQKSSSQLSDSEYKEPFSVTEPDSYLIPARKEFITQLYQINRSSPARNSILDNLLEYYLEWRNTKTYLVFREELIGPKLSIIEHYRAVLASKRGNEVYQWRLKNRIKDLKNLFPSTDLTNSAHSLSRSKILYITLTYSGHNQMPIGESWDSRISKDFHRFTARLRRKYGRIAIIRCFSAHKDGYPHIHMLILFEDTEWRIKYYHEAWCLQYYSTKKKIQKMWGCGNIDIKAITNPKKGVNRIARYILGDQKNNVLDDLSLALSWLFRKRSFSISDPDLIRQCIIETTKSVKIQVDLNLDPILSQFYHIRLIGIVNIAYLDRPPPFSINLNKSEKLKSCVLSVVNRIVNRRFEYMKWCKK